MLQPPGGIAQRLAEAERLWLFLDYDGTLADFAPTPDHINPDPELVSLLTRLAQDPQIRVAVVSGRRLSHVQQLVPVPEILLAGTYGIELLLPGGQRIDRLEFCLYRPVLDALEPRWAGLIVGREGFYLEDKGWALALHARFADKDETERVLAEARSTAADAARSSSKGSFQILSGHKFLEIGPKMADKGRTVADLLDAFHWPGALPLYVGDDDKDEKAFAAVKAHGGIAVVVTAEPRDTEADWRVDSPQAVRNWLETLLDAPR